MRCNLQDSPNGACKHCLRHNRRCVVRTSLRSARLPDIPTNSSPVQAREMAQDGAGQPQPLFAAGISPTRTETSRDVQSAGLQSPKAGGQQSYVGRHTLLAHDAVAQEAVPSGILPLVTPRNESILQFTEATVLPKPPLLEALTDTYFQRVFHRYPVAERADLTDPNASILLKQAICMAGSLMRPSSKAQGLAFTHSLYEKTKIMLLLNSDSDAVAVLGAMCLMICWSANPTDSLSLDCPWHWTGSAIRLALQMGLHRESTYIDRPEAGRVRRMWWILLVSSFRAMLVEYLLLTLSSRMRTGFRPRASGVLSRFDCPTVIPNLPRRPTSSTTIFPTMSLSNTLC